MIVINLTNQENKPMTYGVENPGNDLGQAQQCGEVTPNNRIPTLPPL